MTVFRIFYHIPKPFLSSCNFYVMHSAVNAVSSTYPLFSYSNQYFWLNLWKNWTWIEAKGRGRWFGLFVKTSVQCSVQVEKVFLGHEPNFWDRCIVFAWAYRSMHAWNYMSEMVKLHILSKIFISLVKYLSSMIMLIPTQQFFSKLAWCGRYRYFAMVTWICWLLTDGGIQEVNQRTKETFP